MPGQVIYFEWLFIGRLFTIIFIPICWAGASFGSFRKKTTRASFFALFTVIIFVLVFSGGEAAHAVKRFTGLYTGPYFDPTTATNITTQLGTHAYLPCKVKQLGNKSVSWIRKRDAHILTVDRYTFIADDRFQAFLVEATDTWTLQVKYVQARDAGQYECQVSTEPKMSHFITLNVVGKYANLYFIYYIFLYFSQTFFNGSIIIADILCNKPLHGFVRFFKSFITEFLTIPQLAK